MTRPLLPPDFVKMPVGLLFDLDPELSPTIKITWLQLRAMAWGKTETPPFTAAEFEELTGTAGKTLYKHMGALRTNTHGAFRWRRGAGSTFIVSFECSDQTADRPPDPAEILENENSQNREVLLSLDLDQKLDQPEQKLVDSQNREFSKSRKPAAAPKPLDQLFEAVADVTGRTPANRDWSKLTGVERGILNKVTGQLRKIGATPQQVRDFPVKFKKLAEDDYRLRRRLEPWDLPKFWSKVYGDSPSEHQPTDIPTNQPDDNARAIAAAINARRSASAKIS